MGVEDKKIKVSSETIAKLVGDIHSLTEVVSAQARTIQMLEARLAVCEGLRTGTGGGRANEWWQKPIVSFQGSAVRDLDAGEQANVR